MVGRMHGLPERARVVVIGGGVMGVSIAYHLAHAGLGRPGEVLLVEKDALGSGSTSKAAGGVRAMFSDAVNIEIGQRSLAVFERFEELFGQDIDLHQVGYLFLVDTPEAVTEFERQVALQNSLGVASRMISPAEAQRLSPFIATDGLLAAAYSPRDGHCTPESVVAGYARAARQVGASLYTGVEALSIERDADRITAVVTDAGIIRCETVVCAAGAWSAALAASAGVDLPVEPVRRQIVITDSVADRPADTPFTIDFATSFYFHNEGRGLLMGMSDPDETPGFKLSRDDAWLAGLAEAIEHRAPALSGVGIASGWAGLYENTPDHNALIGEVPGVDRFLYATGFSGHGFLMGPTVGEIIRDLYLRRTPCVDISGLDASRFAAGGLRPELNIV